MKAVERVPFGMLLTLHDALEYVRAMEPPTFEAAIAEVRSGYVAYGPHGIRITLPVLRWAWRWVRRGVTPEDVRERLTRGYNPPRRSRHVAMNFVVPDKPLFELGQLVATPGAIRALEDSGDHPLKFLSRHVTGDWGLVEKEDWEANDMAVQHGGRILSVYRTSKGTKLWIITEADRSVTTILLPEEY